MPRKNAALFSIDDIVEQANLIYVRKKIWSSISRALGVVIGYNTEREISFSDANVIYLNRYLVYNRCMHQQNSAKVVKSYVSYCM
jgi:hypothetical protein